ncbi:hypothetical protein T492DRAFT_871006 [Pavlovales sp. CCMP2436]|nr:hypothetical protein T492DRAFT_871006 [Pavlovales sp. CCMP2436]
MCRAAATRHGLLGESKRAGRPAAGLAAALARAKITGTTGVPPVMAGNSIGGAAWGGGKLAAELEAGDGGGSAS